jgi:hypothetical protein
MFTNQNIINNTSPAADTPQPATQITPEAVIDQLRALRSQIPEVAPLTAKQRRALRNRSASDEQIVQASINVIGVSDNVAAALGQPIGDARTLQDQSIRWKAVEDEARGFLSGISGANFLRRQQLAVLGAQAYSIGSQLARNPGNDILVPHVEEIKRLKRLTRTKKSASPAPKPSSPTPANPTAPATPSVPAPAGAPASGAKQ